MPKIAFVCPPSTLKEQYGSLYKAAPVLPSLGIGFMAKYLKLQGEDCDFFDLLIADSDMIADFISKVKDYVLIGMTVYITTLPNVIEFARKIKKINPNCYIVVGGPHATLFPEDLHDESIDFIVSGEGEYPIYKIFREIGKENPDFSSIDGLTYREKNRYTFTRAQALIEDLDYIDSPLIEKFDMSLYSSSVHYLGKKIIHTITSRGCPFNCRFCAAAQIFKRKFRARSVDLVIEELTRYVNMGYDSVVFYDDSFTINKRRVAELCKKMIARKLKIKWACFTRTDLVDKETLSYMKEAGCYLIVFGCESGNDKTLTLLNKKLTVEKNYEGISMVNRCGILVQSSFMIGLPGEDYKDIENTISFAKNAELTFALFPIFEPYKGTPIFDICKENGEWIKDPRFKNNLLEHQEEIWVPKGLSRADIEVLAQRAVKEFYMRPKIFNKIISRIILKQPMNRKLRLLGSGLHYFIFRHFQTSQKRIGSRYV